MLDFLGYIIIFLGSCFLLLSSIGLFRMPDTFSKIHAGTKSTTLGTILVVLGCIFLEPSLWLKLSLLIVFILLTNPLSSSILADSVFDKNSKNMEDKK
ncbi:MAG: monovalent cation/H(+) antiporter subunit G [Campylobacterota bacterium]|nr:monovalent cation/H(+) antiporter subunit G [Campylobacterota bacterium]